MAEPISKFILASASPRRADILRAMGLDFEVVPSCYVEPEMDGEPPSTYVVRAARGKVADVASRITEGLVVGADTVVVVDGYALGKPKDDEDAKRMLLLLSGRWHAVMTGLAVRNMSTGAEFSD